MGYVLCPWHFPHAESSMGYTCLPGISLMLSHLLGTRCVPGTSPMLSRVQGTRLFLAKCHLGEEKAAMLGSLIRMYSVLFSMESFLQAG